MLGEDEDVGWEVDESAYGNDDYALGASEYASHQRHPPPPILGPQPGAMWTANYKYQDVRNILGKNVPLEFQIGRIDFCFVPFISHCLIDGLIGFFADNPHHMQQNHAPQTGGTRTNQQVEKLIARYEGPEFEEYLRLGNTIDIVDVRADDHLGPNPRATVMKQLTEQEANPPPRPMVVKGKVNKTAKQKGQITFLAAQAVARESELQNEWSRNRASRQAASSRYGF